MILGTVLAALLYVSNERAGTIQVVDTATDRVVGSARGRHRATLVVGTEPEGVTASPDGRWCT